MKALVLMILVATFSYTKVGTAPICLFDGNLMQCFYYTWDACQQMENSYARCVANPGGQ